MQTSKFPIKTYPKMERKKIVSRKGVRTDIFFIAIIHWDYVKNEGKKMGSRCRQAIKLTRIFVIKHLNED